MKSKLNVLLVEDNAQDALLIREMFSKEPPDTIQMTHLVRMRDAETELAKGGADIVLLDMGLPDAHGFETVRRARAAAPGVPIIVLTGLHDDAFAEEAMQEGAQDYLIKGQIENRALPRALRYAIERYRMHADAELSLLRQLQYKDQFLSHVSHELRSPLSAIYQFVTLVLDDLAGPVNPAQHQYLDIVLRNVKQLQAMIDDLLEVTRAQSGKMAIDLQRTSIEEAIHFVVDSLQGAAAQKHISLTAELQHPLPSLWADPNRIRQIAIILLDNAIKFTPEGGTVQVRAHSSDHLPFVTMEVADSGPGIKPDMNERVFERLYQEDDASAGRKGLGLGLHICKGLVIRQGGTIRVVNAPLGGAVFSATLPVFSLPRVLAPALQDETRQLFTLMVIESTSQVGWTSLEARTETSKCIRVKLQQCIYADRDVLLGMVSARDCELFFLLCATDAAGVPAISKKLLKQLDDCESLQFSSLVHTISPRSLPSIGRRPGESIEACTDRVAAILQPIMDDEISRITAKIPALR